VLNVLIKFTYRLRNKEEFESIINKFSEYIFIEIEYNKENFTTDIIMKKLDELKKIYREINNIIIISNVKDVIFLWNKIYNELGKFIFFIDKYNYNILKTEKIISNIEENSNKDRVLNKIYINISSENFENIIEDMFKMNSFKYFETLDKMGIKSGRLKKNSSHKEKDIHYNEKIVEIEFENEKKKMYLSENEKIFGYLYLYLIRKNGVANCRTIILELFKHYKKNYGIENILKIKKFIIDNKKVLFIEKIGILSLMIYLEIESANISREIFEILKYDNDKNINDYPAILINLLSYGSFVQFKAHDEIESDYKMLFDNVCNNLYKQIILDKNSEYEDSNKIAIIVDSLHGDIYSSTKFIIKLIKGIQKYHPNYKIKIFVEDSFKLLDTENNIVYSQLINQVPSFYYAKYHKMYFDEEITIEYFNKDSGNLKKIENMINSINTYNPSIIISTSLISFVLNKLSENYPIVYLSMGKVNIINYFDIFIGADIGTKIKKTPILEKKKVISYDINLVFDFEESTKEYRGETHVDESYINLVTVGVRLNIEMDNKFIENIILLLKNNSMTRWYIIGTDYNQYIFEKYKEIINKKIFFVKFEGELPSFYKKCKVYLNPDRDSGGYSIAEAIVNGVSVFALKRNKVASYYCGDESLFESFEEYFNKLKESVDKKEILKKINIEQLKNIKQIDKKNVIDRIMIVSDTAKRIFYNRKGIVMEEKPNVKQ
jgi:hypothetical protein